MTMIHQNGILESVLWQKHFVTKVGKARLVGLSLIPVWWGQHDTPGIIILCILLSAVAATEIPVMKTNREAGQHKAFHVFLALCPDSSSWCGHCCFPWCAGWEGGESRQWIHGSSVRCVSGGWHSACWGLSQAGSPRLWAVQTSLQWGVVPTEA